MLNDGRQPLVLIVEDDPILQQALQKFLEILHFDVITARTADDALDHIHNQRIDAAIVDLCLPQGSGRDIVVSVPAHIPVIIFSGAPEQSCELERLRPRTRLIAKPYSLLLLVETLREMMQLNGQQADGQASDPTNA